MFGGEALVQDSGIVLRRFLGQVWARGGQRGPRVKDLTFTAANIDSTKAERLVEAMPLWIESVTLRGTRALTRGLPLSVMRAIRAGRFLSLKNLDLGGVRFVARDVGPSVRSLTRPFSPLCTDSL
mmetsp:Transcript_23116/g.45490  ORF Transcript_23116/g.45490 Transcript_23116/m.45490 type:complete len:125 (+) Transcript_23116:128-502(+)